MKSIATWGFVSLLAAAGLTVHAPTVWAASHEGARATLLNVEGEKVGSATLEETPHGVLVSLDLTGIPAGVHAFHIHAVGKCEPPFDSAGGHFNPAGKEHGIKNPAGMHAGDFPNLEVPESGKLQINLLASHVTLGEGSNSLFDEDGSALVVHAGPDDYSTDPAGNAGPRIACGVVEK